MRVRSPCTGACKRLKPTSTATQGKARARNTAMKPDARGRAAVTSASWRKSWAAIPLASELEIEEFADLRHLGQRVDKDRSRHDRPAPAGRPQDEAPGQVPRVIVRRDVAHDLLRIRREQRHE